MALTNKRHELNIFDIFFHTAAEIHWMFIAPNEKFAPNF